MTAAAQAGRGAAGHAPRRACADPVSFPAARRRGAVSLREQLRRRETDTAAQGFNLRRAGEFAMLAAAVILATAFAATLREMPEARAAIERSMVAEIAHENREFCGRLGYALASREYRVCIMELNEIRAKHAARMVHPF